MPQAPMPDSFLLFDLLRRSYWAFRSVVDLRLEPIGLSNAQWRPLIMLYRLEKPATQTELAKLLHIEAPTLVRMLDRLTAKELVIRRRCPGDRRAHHVELTPAAIALCEQISAALHELCSEAVVGLPPAHAQILFDSLQAICDNLGRMGSQAPEPV